MFRDAALIMKNIIPSYFDVFSGGLLSNLTVNTPLALPIGMIIIQLLTGTHATNGSYWGLLYWLGWRTSSLSLVYRDQPALHGYE